jgi:thiosulfate/3-mercaptopyruvate sulfurtransferase
MQQLFEFLGNNPLLTAAFFGILTVIIIVEVRRFRGGGDIEALEATQLYNKQNAVFLDVRKDPEFRKGHLPGAVHAPGDALDSRLPKLARYKDKPVIVYCNTGMQSARVVARLRKEGFQQVHQLRGGLQAWQGAGFPIEGK